MALATMKFALMFSIVLFAMAFIYLASSVEFDHEPHPIIAIHTPPPPGLDFVSSTLSPNSVSGDARTLPLRPPRVPIHLPLVGPESLSNNARPMSSEFPTF
ncbi:hypothetical protein AMTR_s00078p00153700 [Amborella trichopoda]|uniref:Uncharacterized protein n=1 Tax=Amborella trichopoda TaxID=13333 RepID=W1P8C1_AMBTC|nr:hypothetical protein AMTR_s00078p00153700 [Amborella trichopoda]